jgi:MFS-type transporter involved in bile tolerance (Atg22 family)
LETLSLWGLGLTIAGVFGLFGGVPLGHLADRRGPREVMLVLLGLLAVTGTVLIFVHTWWQFVVVASVEALLDRGSGAVRGAMIAAIMITQFVGVPCAFLFGTIAGRIGAKRAVFGALVAYTGISVFGYFMTTATHFLVLAVAVGMVQGGAQALSRSLFASMIPRQRSGQFFGFFGVIEKFAGIMGPALWAAVLAIGGPGRAPILSVIAFFVVGGVLLAFVNVERGQAVARAAEAEAPRAPRE